MNCDELQFSPCNSLFFRNKIMYNDSTQKIMMYITSLIKGEFNLEGKTYKEKRILVSRKILRPIDCVRHCGACCLFPFTMDFLPNETLPDVEHYERLAFGKKIVTLRNNRPGKGLRCLYLDLTNGDCKVHLNRAFSCDFEMLRFKQYNSTNTVVIGSFPYGRGWAMKQWNGEMGAKCVISEEFREDYKEDVIRKLYRLKDWIDYYEVPTHIEELISYVKSLNYHPKEIITLNNWNPMLQEK